MQFSGKTWLIIILKVTKKHGFTLSLSISRKHIFGKTTRVRGAGCGRAKLSLTPHLQGLLGLKVVETCLQ